MAFKPIDPKRDEYRRYLERGGIIESLTKVFVRILKERPEDPTQYLLQNLGDARLQADNIAYLQSELEDARSEIQRLTEIIRSINPDLLVEPPSNNVSINNDNHNESIGVKVEAEDATLPTSLEPNAQPTGEYSEVVALEQGLQNTHIVGSNTQEAVGGGDAVHSEVLSSAE